MQMECKIALIPAYEPSQSLPELARQLCRAGFQPVVVNDGSGGAYSRIFDETARYAHVLTHRSNRGKGRALKTGLQYIRKNYPHSRVIVTVDADGQHSVQDAVRVGDIALWNQGMLVLGSRHLGAGCPARSRFGNTVTRLVYHLSTGARVSDTQTGLRAFGTDLIPFMLGVAGERYEYEMNVLLECTRRNIPIREVEIRTIYLNNNAASHFNTVRDSFRVYREIVKFAASSFTGFLVDYGMYSLLTVLTGGLGSSVSIPLSNVAARLVSASVNYTINRKLVFKSGNSAAKSAAQYFVLAACILAGNTLLLNFLVNTAGIGRFTAKLLTEASFFVLSWLVQRFLIFGKKGAARSKNGLHNG